MSGHDMFRGMFLIFLVVLIAGPVIATSDAAEVPETTGASPAPRSRLAAPAKKPADKPAAETPAADAPAANPAAPAAITPLDAKTAAKMQREWAMKNGMSLRKLINVEGGLLVKCILIPPGEFMMGSDAGVGKGDEKPKHRVKISKPFYMSIHEITQKQFNKVLKGNPSHFQNDKNPVEQMKYEDAEKFCKALSKKTGQTISLPTEAQWEYACRAGSMSKFSFGDLEKKLGDYAWFHGNSKNEPHPVGTKKPNAWGLYDMHGNVLEYCGDWYAAGYYAKSPAEDPTGPAEGTTRVMRGGGWGYGSAGECRSAARIARASAGILSRQGFRIIVQK